jgi:hypothetical protein
VSDFPDNELFSSILLEYYEKIAIKSTKKQDNSRFWNSFLFPFARFETFAFRHIFTAHSLRSFETQSSQRKNDYRIGRYRFSIIAQAFSQGLRECGF